MTRAAELVRWRVSASPIVTRARDLVRLAADSGASEAEARTAAHAACRLIAQHELVIAPREPERHQHAERASSPRVIVSRYVQRCIACARAVRVGERVLWRRGEGVSHLECSS